MSAQTQPLLPFIDQRVRAKRERSRDKVEAYFIENLGDRMTSRELHWRFGSAVRTRISEINRDPNSTITITNETLADSEGNEHSAYRATLKGGIAVNEMHPKGDAIKGRPCLSPSALEENGDQLPVVVAVYRGRKDKSAL